MNSKELYRLTTTILCMTIILILVHCTSSQPLSASSEKVDDTIDNSLWLKPSSDSESNESDESMSKLFLLHSDFNRMNQADSSGPVRRANFWKRANFWRKRANFWRRDAS